jgi:topoisomerase-4 subunit A
VPYGVTTTQLMESIVKANDQGKIKIKKVIDHTAAEVEIQIDLAPAFRPILRLMRCMHLPIVK